MSFYGISPVINVLILLVVSFFVLLAIPKADSRNIKQFGRAVVIAILITALYLAGISIYSNLKGDSCPYKHGKYGHGKYGKVKMYRHHEMMR
ncbi:MAG: hypothetical protein JSW18_02510 [Candidatus Omnitrophota bacterium]|nr:MAG: hypothetical protein JSW18_02510 [Candidatus Omnitrophota bacterium]